MRTGSSRRGVAGRIVSRHMRPLAFCERGLTEAAVSLKSLFDVAPVQLEGETTFALADYVEEILACGFPGIRGLPSRARTGALISYLDRALDRDISEAGVEVRRPAALRAWLQAYAAASSTTTSYTSILDAATPGESDKPAKATVLGYREGLERMWLLDPVPAWWRISWPIQLCPPCS